jgi:Protein of unknown function (DUF3568)
VKKAHLLLTVLLVGTAVVAQGCLVAAVGAGTGTVAYLRGDLKGVEAKHIDAVYAAAKAATKQLELTVISETKDEMSAVIVARDAQDKKVTITLKAPTEDTTDVSIRVGLFGNETKSRRIYEQIKKNLQ